MKKRKCDYCGKTVEEEEMQALNNGSPACPDCVEEEEINSKKKELEQKNKVV